MWLIPSIIGLVCLGVLTFSLKSKYLGPYFENHHRRILLIAGGLAFIAAFLLRQDLLTTILLSVGILEFGLGVKFTLEVTANKAIYQILLEDSI